LRLVFRKKGCLLFNKTEEGKVFRRDERRNMGM